MPLALSSARARHRIGERSSFNQVYGLRTDGATNICHLLRRMTGSATNSDDFYVSALMPTGDRRLVIGGLPGRGSGGTRQ